jgi:hypothetical protein
MTSLNPLKREAPPAWLNPIWSYVGILRSVNRVADPTRREAMLAEAVATGYLDQGAADTYAVTLATAGRINDERLRQLEQSRVNLATARQAIEQEEWALKVDAEIMRIAMGKDGGE